MRNKIFAFFFVIMLSISLTGCWDATDIKDQTIVTLVGVDRIDDEMKFMIEYKLPANRSSETTIGSGNQSSILIGEGEDFTEAKNSYLRKGDQDIFLGAVRALVFSDNFSTYGIEEYMNRLRGTSKYRRTITIFTTSTEMNKLFNVNRLNSNNIGYDIEHLSEQLNKNGLLYKATVSEVLENSRIQNTGYLLSNLSVINERIELSGYSIFKNNKKVGVIPADKMKGINFLLLKESRSDYKIHIDDVEISLSTLLKSRKIKAYYDGENIAFDVKVLLDAEILYLSKEYKLDDEKKKELESKISDIVKVDILKTIETSQKDFGCDYLYFYKYFRARYNSDFKNLKWNNKYKNAEFNVEVNAKIVPGNLVNFN